MSKCNNLAYHLKLVTEESKFFKVEGTTDLQITWLWKFA